MADLQEQVPGFTSLEYSSSRPSMKSNDVRPRCMAEIDLDYFRNNIRVTQKLASEGRCKVMPIIKANGYGHGAVQLAKSALQCGVDFFGVATIYEGVELRNAGVACDILVLGAPDRSELDVYLEHNLDLTVPSLEVAEWLLQDMKSRPAGQSIHAHVKIDTGMSRIGLQLKEAIKIIQDISNSKQINLRALCTHMAIADDKESNFTNQQIGRFIDLLKEVQQLSIKIPIIHFSNSMALLNQFFKNDYIAGILESAETVGYVRPGICLYEGYTGTIAGQALIQPMTLKAQIRHIHLVSAGETVGYSRYSRHLSNCGVARIGEHIYQVSGNVCMDMIMIDLGSPEGTGSNVQVGEYAILFGPDQDHKKNPTITTLANLASTISYELFCSVSQRVPRIYKNADGTQSKPLIIESTK